MDMPAAVEVIEDAIAAIDACHGIRRELRIVGYDSNGFHELSDELESCEQDLRPALELARQIAEASNADDQAEVIIGPPDHTGLNDTPYRANREALQIVRTRLVEGERMQSILQPVKSSPMTKVGIRTDASPRKVLLALQRCVVATLDQSTWSEFAYLISEDAASWVKEDSRLLRSLSFGDEDYGQRVFAFLETFVGEKLHHLRTCVEFLRLESWLRREDPSLFEELFGAGGPKPAEADLASLVDASAIRENLVRLQRQKGDPPALIGTAKDLIESTAKIVLADRGCKAPDDLAGLVKAAQHALELHASQANGGDESVLRATKRIRGGLSTIALGVVELRNSVGTGHGRLSGHADSELTDEAQLAAAASSLWITNILAAHAKVPLSNNDKGT